MIDQMRWIILTLVLCGAAGMAWAEPTAPPARVGAVTRTEKLDELEIERAKLTMETAKADMDQKKITLDETSGLYEQKIVSKLELERDRQAYTRAELDYKKARIELQKTRLQFLKDATLLTIVSAEKIREQGQYWVKIVLRNDSDMNKARIAMGSEISDKEIASLLNVANVVVTLTGQAHYIKSFGGQSQTYTGIVGDPFQHVVSMLKQGEEVELEYQLLYKSVDAVTVHLDYFGESKEYPLLLKKQESQDLPTISSYQYAQQGQLGSEVLYELELELPSRSVQSFALIVLNLPKQIPGDFIDPTGGRVTQIKFTEQISKHSLTFKVSLSERLDQEFIDKNITFEIVIARPAEVKTINKLVSEYKDKTIPAEVLAKINGERVELILIPTGVGKLEILITNQYNEITQGEQVALKFNVHNSGTLAMRKVTPKLDLPLDWESELTPKGADIIEPGEKQMFTAEIRPPLDVAIGEFTTKITAEGHTGIEIIEALDKNFTVRIAAKRNITATFILVAVLIGLVLVIAIASVKISRR